MKTCFQIAECSLSYAKISKKMKEFSLFKPVGGIKKPPEN